MNAQQLAHQYRIRTPREWRILAGAHPEALPPVADLLLADASHAVFRAAYVDARACGCKHDRAVTIANKTLTRVRAFLRLPAPASTSF